MNRELEAGEQAKIELLLAALTFDLIWTRYVTTPHRHAEEAAKTSARELVDAFERLLSFSGELPKDFDPFFKMSEVVDSRNQRLAGTDLQLPRRLLEWAGGSDKWPYVSYQVSIDKLSQWLETLRNGLLPDIRLRVPSVLYKHWSAIDSRIREDLRRWSPYLPSGLRTEAPEELMKEASREPSLVLVADIRKSKELMIHSPDHIYARFIERFFSECKLAVDRAGGVFDKFTGDGFIAYFNPLISTSVHYRAADYRADFLDCLLEIKTNSEELFQEWTQHITRLPGARIGLAFGADHGILSFDVRDKHLVAVGEALVWASRLAQAEEASAGSVLINNPLFQVLKGRDAVKADKKTITVKDDCMQAWAIQLHEGNLIRDRILAYIGCCEKGPTRRIEYREFGRNVCSWTDDAAYTFEKYREPVVVSVLEGMVAEGLIDMVREIDRGDGGIDCVPTPAPYDHDIARLVGTAAGVEAGKALLRSRAMKC